MFYIERLDSINKDEISQILNIWESSIRATHLFLTEEHIAKLKLSITKELMSIDVLLVARDKEYNIKGFMSIAGNKIKMLFISNDSIGKGIGKKLLYHGFSIYNVQYVDVYEQNSQVIEFYKYMDFEVFNKSNFDEYGNKLPILNLRLKLFSI